MQAGDFAKRILFVLACVLAASAVLLIGCGTAPTRNGYERDIAPAGKHVDRALGHLAPDAQTPATPEQVREIADDVRSAQDDVEAVAPPKAVVVAHRKLQAGLGDLGAALDTLAAELEDAGDDAQRQQAWLGFPKSDRATEAAAELEGARTLYEREGYRIFGEAAS